MRGLLRFIIRRHAFFLFLILEIVSFSLLVQNNDRNHRIFLNSANEVSGFFLKNFRFVSDYFELKKVNQELMEENNHLRNRLQALSAETDYAITQVNDTAYDQHYFYITANVINNSISRAHNYMTLDKGANHGIKPEMAVVSKDGIVGVVRDVSPNYCTIISLLNRNLKISAKIKKNGYFGSLEWEGQDYRKVRLHDIPAHVEVGPGDTIITSGYSAIFPEGVAIGTVEEIDKNSGASFISLELRLSTDFKNLHYVYVIGNLMKQEQVSLEKELN